MRDFHGRCVVITGAAGGLGAALVQVFRAAGAHVVALDSFPLTPNRKVDRKALPAPSARVTDAARDFAPTEDSVEEAIAGVWARVLGVPRVGRRDRHGRRRGRVATNRGLARAHS